MTLDPWSNLSRYTPPDIRALQNQKLRRFISEQLYPFSPHYRQVFDRLGIKPDEIRTVEDLKRIPFTSKTDFIATPEHPDKSREFVLQPNRETIRRHWPLAKQLPILFLAFQKGQDYAQEKISREYRPSFVTFTTGTTNKPVSFLYSEWDIRNLYLSGSRMLNLFGIKKDERIFNMFPYAPHLAFWQVVFAGLAECVTIFSSGGGKCLATEGQIAAILRMRPSILLGVPSYVYHVLREARDKKSRMEFLRQVVLGAARVTEGFKSKLRELLFDMGAAEVAILGTYGFTEARCAWAECPAQPGHNSGYHLYPDQEIIEIIDPDTGEVKKAGEDGEIVYTPLDARGSVVLRYRTGDFVKGGVSFSPCPYCHRGVARLSTDITRLSDVKGLNLSKIKGSLVNLNDLANVLNEMPNITEWQVEIKKRNDDPHDVDELLVYISPKEGCDRNKLEVNIRKNIQLCSEVSPNAVNFLSLEEIVRRLELETANKEKRILDTRPRS